MGRRVRIQGSGFREEFQVQGSMFKVSLFDPGLTRLRSRGFSCLCFRCVGGRWNERLVLASPCCVPVVSIEGRLSGAAVMMNG
jgi:hypothetical protein